MLISKNPFLLVMDNVICEITIIIPKIHIKLLKKIDRVISNFFSYTSLSSWLNYLDPFIVRVVRRAQPPEDRHRIPAQ